MWPAAPAALSAQGEVGDRAPPPLSEGPTSSQLLSLLFESQDLRPIAAACCLAAPAAAAGEALPPAALAPMTSTVLAVRSTAATLGMPLPLLGCCCCCRCGAAAAGEWCR